MEKSVELPAEYLRWVLSQRKEDYRVPTLEEDYPAAEAAGAAAREAACRAVAALQLTYDEFAEFRGWVRGVLEGDAGRVAVGEGTAATSLDLRAMQESIDRKWPKARKELAAAAMEEADGNVGEEEMTTAAASPLGPHTYMLSVYLSLLYQHAAPVPTFWGP